MATIILSAVGTAVGGPLGGTIGTLIGTRVDQAIFGGGGREGPRLTDLAVQTSQYGALVPRIYGQMRVAGTVIWATDLIERRERQGGGKGSPGTVQFAYSVSMAVALSSRPIKAIKRIWAEGNLLRGAAGDFKTTTGFRFYNGHGDQRPDPLIAALESEGEALGYRGLAYCVFEELDLTDFGNRIPSLTFEIEADDGALSPRDIAQDIVRLDPASAHQPREMLGYSAQADRQQQILEELATAFPHHLDWTEQGLYLARRDLPPSPSSAPSSDFAPLIINHDDILHADEAAAEPAEQRIEPLARPQQISLRYYEPERDYQAGIRRSINGNTGRAPQIFDMPAALTAANAQDITQRLYRFSQYQDHERIVHLARLDPQLRPGRSVQIQGETSIWRVTQWRFADDGITLNLVRDNSVKTPPLAQNAEAGRSNHAPDIAPVAADAVMLDLPAWQNSSANRANLHAAVRAAQPHWRGGTLYRASADNGLLDMLTPVSSSADFGVLQNAIGPSDGLHMDAQARALIHFPGDDPVLQNIDDQALQNGENLILVGREVMQIARAEFLGDGHYALSQLYRALGDGTGGKQGHEQGTQAVLLNYKVQPVMMTGDVVRSAANFALVSRAVEQPHYVQTDIIRAVQPLAPVHMTMTMANDTLCLQWVRRSRIPSGWRSAADTPLVEEREAYSVTFFADADPATPLLALQTERPEIILSAQDSEMLRATGQSISAAVQQLGTYALSPPAFLQIL